MPSSSPDFLQPQGITVHVHGVAESVSNEVDDLFKLLTEVELPPWVTSGWYPPVDKDCHYVLQSLANHYVLKDSEDYNASAPAIPHQFFDLIPLLARAVHETQRSYAKGSQSLSSRTGNERNLLSFLTSVFLVLFPRDSIKSDAQYATCIDVCCSNSPLSLLLRRGDTVDLVIAYKVPSIYSSPDLEVVSTRASDDDDGSGPSPLATSSQDSGASSQYNLPSPMSMSEWLADPNTHSDDDSSTDFYLMHDHDTNEPADESLLKSFFLGGSAGEVPVLCVAPCRKIYSVLASALLARRECGICSPLVGLAFDDASLNVFVVIGWILESNLGCPEIHVRHAPSDGPLSIDCGAFSLLNPAESLCLTLALDRLAREVLQPASVLEAQHSQLDATRLGELRRSCWRIDVAKPERTQGWTSRDLEAWARGVVLDEADLCTHSLLCFNDPAGIEHSTADLSIMPPKPSSKGRKGTSKDGTASTLESIPEETRLPSALSLSKFAYNRKRKTSHWRWHISQLDAIVMTHTLAPPWAQPEDRAVENKYPIPMNQYSELAGRISLQDFAKVHAEMRADHTNYALLPPELTLNLESQLRARNTAGDEPFTLQRDGGLEDNEIRLIASTFLLVLNQYETRKILRIDESTIFSSSLELAARRIWDQINEISFREISEQVPDIGSPKKKTTYSASEQAQVELQAIEPTVQALPECKMQLPRSVFFDHVFGRYIQQLHESQPHNPQPITAALTFCGAVDDHFREGAEQEKKAAVNIYVKAVLCALEFLRGQSTNTSSSSPTFEDLVTIAERGIPPHYFSGDEHKSSLEALPSYLRYRYGAAYTNLKATYHHHREIKKAAEDWTQSSNVNSERNLAINTVSRATLQPVTGTPDFAVSVYFKGASYLNLPPLLSDGSICLDDSQILEEGIDQFNAIPHQATVPLLATDPAETMSRNFKEQLGPLDLDSNIEDDIFVSRQHDEIHALELAIIPLRTDAKTELKTEPRTEIETRPATEAAAATKVLPQEVALSSEPALPKVIPKFPSGVGFPIFLEENKRFDPDAGMQQGSVQLRSCLHSPVVQLASTGIYDFPVFGMVAKGHSGVLTCMWAEKDGLRVGSRSYDIIHSAERHCLSFELTSALGVLDYVVFLSLLRTRHIPLLAKRFAEAMAGRVQTQSPDPKPNFTDHWQIKNQRESMHALFKELQISKDQLLSHSAVALAK